MKKVLILGGTAEARALADELEPLQIDFISSLAGRVSTPRLPKGEVRIGGFGGVEGLAQYLSSGGFTHVIDATHPFATQMSANARGASAKVGIKLLRLARPGWAERLDAGNWHWVNDLSEAAEVAHSLGSRLFITTGRQSLFAYKSWVEQSVLVRVVEPPQGRLPEVWTMIYDRGPYTVSGEIDLLGNHQIDVLTTKDSGGSYTSAKLDACAQLDIPVVVVRRPGEGLSPSVSTIKETVAWLN